MGWQILPASLVLLILSLVLGYVTSLSGTIWIAFMLHLVNNAIATG
jgi:hypothetical protein